MHRSCGWPLAAYRHALFGKVRVTDTFHFHSKIVTPPTALISFKVYDKVNLQEVPVTPQHKAGETLILQSDEHLSMFVVYSSEVVNSSERKVVHTSLVSGLEHSQYDVDMWRAWRILLSRWTYSETDAIVLSWNILLPQFRLTFILHRTHMSDLNFFGHTYSFRSLILFTLSVDFLQQPVGALARVPTQRPIKAMASSQGNSAFSNFRSMTTQDQSQRETSPHPSRTKRTLIACVRCRARKVKVCTSLLWMNAFK